MGYNFSIEVQKQIKDSLEVVQSILGSDLLGVYLFGSAVIGGLQTYSDLDLFVVANRQTTSKEKAKLISHLLQISGIYMKSSKPPIELTLVEKKAINPWTYPPHFDFQYGEWLRKPFERGVIRAWESQEMPDLAILVTQVLLKSQTLWGSKPEQLLVDVPYHDFIKAMLHDLDRLIADLEDDTRNVLLTLARTWSTIETNSIRSKPAAADWVISHLPERYQPVMKRAKSICIGNENEHWDDINTLIKPCAEFMLSKIHKQSSLIDRGNQRITLAEASR
ncbi:MAG: Streptomycin 3''-adenylyltransferase [Chlamydiales bacterium]|nr:Streptomycin 3''-adenylyltransferase [Chlamydiales bacterium]MCH9619203.1 Streptomycin 3''-adenylyltransferase [Chlamydiales bacterium]MCH9622465.1 Streptomycin 3''-adenylyltransferase [Chlamydiales bacterium]